MITIVDYPLDLRVGHKKGKQLNTNHFPFIKSGYQDSNLGPPAPKAGALTGLRYTPKVYDILKIHFFFILSGYQDSNLGPPAPKAGALTGLRYTPKM